MCFFAHMQSENRELPNKCETSPSLTRMQTAISEITTVHKRLRCEYQYKWWGN